MPTRTLDGQIDRLYQLPLDEFTEARNALAKETGNSEIRRLTKPPAAAWAINQVYWSQRPVYDALAASAAALRNAHASVLAGKRADLRAAGKEHEDALEAALKAALAILSDAGQPATDATKQAIASTLRGLPSSGDQPGRLARTLQPGGFELLAGLPLGGSAPAPRPKPSSKEPETPEPGTSRKTARDDRAKSAEHAKTVSRAKEALAEAQRAEKAADQNARREEFEAARTARDAERAETRLAEARAALEAAQEALDDAESEASAAARKKEAASRRVRETADTLARAHVRAEAARAALARAEKG
jgi:hypothetical protein